MSAGHDLNRSRDRCSNHAHGLPSEAEPWTHPARPNPVGLCEARSPAKARPPVGQLSSTAQALSSMAWSFRTPHPGTAGRRNLGRWGSQSLAAAASNAHLLANGGRGNLGRYPRLVLVSGGLDLSFRQQAPCRGACGVVRGSRLDPLVGVRAVEVLDVPEDKALFER
jgi:hypothetical protein